nr:replicase [Bamboo mosaic virus]UCU83264.1 replicase [Bamboo mosaic virus]UCU83269.1 replicase [Bamboo mosaic virus]UCU83274.1 replicase [Bamboo mosaic virus]
MALVAKVFDSITDPSLRAVLQEEAHTQVKQTLKDTALYSRYALLPAAANTLERYAIPHNPFSTKLHTHAAAKALENDLYKTASYLLPKERVTFLFMKPSKMQYFRRRGDSDTFVNADLVAKDLARYPLDTIYPHLPEIQTKMAFIGDSLHYFQPEVLEHIFASSPKLETLLATIVLPPEATRRLKSLYPEIYTLHYMPDKFLYKPGGLSGGEYEHDYKDLAWLHIGHVSTPTMCLTVDRVESKAANHLLLIRRGRLKLNMYRSYDTPEPMVVVPRVFLPPKYNAQKPISKTKANSWILYVKSAGEPKIRDVWAKLRQTISNAELNQYEPAELLLLTNYFYILGKLDSITSFDTLLSDNILKRLFRPAIAKLQELKHWITGPTAFMQLYKALQLIDVDFTFEVTKNWNERKPEEKEPELPKDAIDSLIESLVGISYADSPTEDAHGPQVKPTPQQETNELPKPLRQLVHLEDAETATQDLTDQARGLTTPQEADQEVKSPETTGSEVAAPEKAEAKESAQETSRPLPWKAWLKLLQGLGFQGDQEQLDTENDLIYPIKHIRQLPVEEFKGPINQTLRKMNRLPCKYLPDIERAAAFARDVMSNKTGAILPKQSHEWKTTLKRKCKLSPRSTLLSVIHGAGGSGKSRALQDYMKTNPEDPIVTVLPTNELRADWKAKLPAHDPDMFMTFENALLVPKGNVVIMDDYTKLPRGYIEAYVQNAPMLDLLILTGDPRQSEHFESNEGNTINDLSPSPMVFSAYSRYYINATHRNNKDLANALGVYSEKQGKTRVTVSNHIEDGRHTLVPSQIKQRNYVSMGRKTSTYAGCQGITAPRVQIIVDNDTAKCSNQVLYTAFSRAADEIHFCNTMTDEKQFWAKVKCTPYLQAILNLTKEHSLPEPKPESDEPIEPKAPITHIAVENVVPLVEEITEPLPEKHEREIFSESTGHSNCIQTENEFIQAFQHQQAKDETLFWATIEKRIVTSTPDANWTEFKTKRPLGDILWLAYKEAMGLPAEPIKFDPDLWWKCADEVQNKYLQKPLHMIKNGILRQSPDFGERHIALFLKSQWVKKNEKIGRVEVKAGQTIAAFYQSTVMLFGTMARYMRRVRERFCPKNILINCEIDQPTASKWVDSHWKFNTLAYTNDFEAYDQSQDGAMLQFEVMKARHHDLPADLIESYIELKLNAKIFLGTLGIMRLTGEGPTFDANTECNIAYTHARFHIPKGTAQLYAGDDCALNCEPIERESFKPLAGQFTLKSKPVTIKQGKGSWPEFCGNIITPYGYLKHPRKTWAALHKSKLQGKDELKKTATAYALDILPTYELGDAIHDIFTDNELTFHYQTVRTLITDAHTKVFANHDSIFGEEGLFSS